MICLLLTYIAACDQGKYPEAERLYQRATGILEEKLGSKHTAVADALNMWAGLFFEQVMPFY